MRRPLPTEKSKTVIGLMKYKLGGRTMKQFVELRTKMHSYLTDDGHVDKRIEGRRKIKFKSYKTLSGK